MRGARCEVQANVLPPSKFPQTRKVSREQYQEMVEKQDKQESQRQLGDGERKTPKEKIDEW